MAKSSVPGRLHEPQTCLLQPHKQLVVDNFRAATWCRRTWSGRPVKFTALARVTLRWFWVWNRSEPARLSESYRDLHPLTERHADTLAKEYGNIFISHENSPGSREFGELCFIAILEGPGHFQFPAVHLVGSTQLLWKSMARGGSFFTWVERGPGCS